MSRFVLYYHGGSKNHGCEAIVRSTQKVLDYKNTVLFSSAVEEDALYGLNNIVALQEDINRGGELGLMDKFIVSICHKIRHDDYLFYTFGHKEFFRQIQKGDICLSIGGDNYCYMGQDILGYYNKKLHSLGSKTVLWGCSVDAKMVNESIKQDLASYDLIVARESISYAFLKAINPNTILCCDPAFQLEKKQTDLPEGFIEGKTIGLNVSPLAGRYGIAYLINQNVLCFIKYLIQNTDLQIALIPHVVKSGDDDRTVLQAYYDSAEDKSRLVLVDDMNCEQLKWIISKCECFIGARTHATIAAYSSCVPTLVMGYSVKSKGIAKDIFGTNQNYVIHVQSLCMESDLTDAFRWIWNNSEQIRTHLHDIMPDYSKTVCGMRERIYGLVD